MLKSDNNQSHGKIFENQIKSSNVIFSIATSDRARSPNERFDIAGKDDKKYGFPTSIKSTGSNTVGLSDARRFWQSMEFLPYRLLVGKWRQNLNIKEFFEIHEIILKKEHKDVLLGSFSLEYITSLHDKIRSYGAGPEQQKEAQNYIKMCKKERDEPSGLIKLNPKIDSKNQRRLQCSVSLSGLVKIIDESDYHLYTKSYNSLLLPLRIISNTRKFKK